MLQSLNPVLISASLSWFIAQCIKTILNGLVKKSLHGVLDILASLAWRTGGMPSSHTALVTALVVSIGIHDGTRSTVFILALFFAIVVIRDTLGVRLSSGQQARVLNKLGKSLEKDSDVDFTVVKEVHGHSPSEVLVGMILGGSIALVTSILAK